MNSKQVKQRDRYPLNAAGDFYVENEACICCMAPHSEAPELMGFDEETSHCYFKRQPQTREELERAIAAVVVSDVQALRYAGTDEYVLRRLADEKSEDCCDAPSPGNSRLKCLLKLLKAKKRI